jgi:hypothetical protein
MRPPRALPAAHFERNENPRDLGDGTLVPKQARFKTQRAEFRFERERLLAAGVSFNVFARAKYSKGYKLVREHKRL